MSYYASANVNLSLFVPSDKNSLFEELLETSLLRSCSYHKVDTSPAAKESGAFYELSCLDFLLYDEDELCTEVLEPILPLMSYGSLIFEGEDRGQWKFEFDKTTRSWKQYEGRIEWVEV